MLRVLRRLLGAHVEISSRHPARVLLACLLVGALAVAVAGQLEFRGDFLELLPASAEEVMDLRRVEKQAGGGGYLIIQVTGADRDTRRAFARSLAPRLEAEQDLVRYVEYRFNTGFFADRALLALPPDRLASLLADLRARVQYEKRAANPLVVDLLEEEPPPDFEAIQARYSEEVPRGEYVESQDGEELYLYVKPTQLAGDLDFNRLLTARVGKLGEAVQADFPSVRMAMTGPYVIRVEEDEVLQQDLATAATLALVLSLGIIFLATRRPVALIIVVGPVLVGISLTFAFASLTVGHLNPVTGFLGAILIGLGIEYGVHLSMRYWEERLTHAPVEAMHEAVQGTFTGALTSAATNAVAFVVLVFAEFAAFKQFGRIAGFGVMATLLAAYAMGPAVLFLAERVRSGRKVAAAARTEAQGARGRPVPTFALAGILLVLIAGAVFSAAVSPQVGFENNLRNLKGESPAVALDDHINEQLGIIMTPALVAVDSLAEARKVSAIAHDIRDERGEARSFAQVASLDDLVPWDPAPRLALIREIRQVIDDLPTSVKEGPRADDVQQLTRMTGAAPWSLEELPVEIRRRFTGVNGGMFVLIFPRYGGYDVGELNLWAADLKELKRRAAAAGIDAPVLDGNRIAASIFTLIKQDGPLIMGLAAVVVFGMIWLSLRRLTHALLVAAPLYLGMTCIVGAMYLFDVRLNFLNVVVLPNLLAIAVDNSVHLFHRYQEEGKGSLGHIMRNTGFAAMVATLSNASGYGAMLVAHHEGLRSVGLLAVLGVACTFVGTTVAFPALLALVERFPRMRGVSARG